jgi:hypothetical protein
MSTINVQKLVDGLTKIVWKTAASNSLKDERESVSPWFKLERVHLDAANAVQLRIEQFEENDYSENAQEAVRFYFTLKLITPGGHRTDEGTSRDSECQPCTALLPKVVWVSINKGNIQTARNKKDENWCTWQSVNIQSLFFCRVQT